MTTLVIGFGSLIRGDDGIGQVLAEALSERLPDVEVITCTQLVPELAEPISRAGRAYFIDACVGTIPAAITCQPILSEQSSGAFSHNVSPSTLLNNAHELYGCAPKSFLISVTGASFEIGAQLSPKLSAALPALTEMIAGWMAIE